MPWNSQTPLAAQSISSTTVPIQQNFVAIQTWTAVDHEVINGAGGTEGMHARVSFVNQGGTTPTFTPTIVPSGQGTLGLYAKDNVDDGNTTTQLFAHIVRKGAGANYAAREIPFTASVLANVESPTTSRGWTYLPSGLLMKWGTSNINTTGFNRQSVNVNSGSPAARGPNMTNILSVQLTLKITPNTTIYNQVISAFIGAAPTNSFDIVRMDNGTNDLSATVQAMWLCIGY